VILHFSLAEKIQGAPDVMSFSIAWRTPSPLMLLSCTEFSFPWSKKIWKSYHNLISQAKHHTCHSMNETAQFSVKKSTQSQPRIKHERLSLTMFPSTKRVENTTCSRVFWRASRCLKMWSLHTVLSIWSICISQSKLKLRKYCNTVTVTISIVQTLL